MKNHSEKESAMKSRNIVLIAIICFSSLYTSSQEVFISKQLVKKWETPPSMITPESVLYDAANDIIYVANINGQSAAKDGNGFISKLSTSGKIINLKWITGLDAPKGMGIYSGKLFVSDITQVVEIDLSNGKILNRYPAAGSSFLNDISISPAGVVYVSDSQKGSIYRLANGKIEKWIEGVEGVNGLLCIGRDLLLAGTKNSVVQIFTINGRQTTLISETVSIDGLVSCGKNSYLFSDWSGSVYRATVNAGKELILNTSKANINAADIDYIPSKRLLVVPTFLDNRVMAYELK
jgi:hypothetical protein